MATGIAIPAVGPCNIAECFTNKSLFGWRDPELDLWLTADLPAVGEGTDLLHSVER
jgi:hypothetical protein